MGEFQRTRLTRTVLTKMICRKCGKYLGDIIGMASVTCENCDQTKKNFVK